ncbi:MAG: M48 family metallopeptidase [Elusimicrobia bacterium]|nr:M48 family metallopeptidase [Elusimicrobiota bacterium]
MRRRLSLFAVLAMAFTACQSVPYTGRSRVLLVSPGEEKKLGEQAYADILKKGKLSTNREQVDLLRRIGMRLAKVADKPDFQWEFNLLDDDKQINAFCLPGGKVAFYTGILPVTAGEDGIAVVMSHEIAHALARHGGERMSQGVLANTGGQVLGAVLGGPGGSQVTSQMYQQIYGLGAGLVVLGYSRKQESEADHIGLILMAKAGYDLEASVSFWGRMAQATGGKGGSNPLEKFLGTHPGSAERQAQLKAWIPEVRAKYSKP